MLQSLLNVYTYIYDNSRDAYFGEVLKFSPLGFHTFAILFFCLWQREYIFRFKISVFRPSQSFHALRAERVLKMYDHLLFRTILLYVVCS